MSAVRLSIEAQVWTILLSLTAANWLLMEVGLWHAPMDHRTIGTAILALAMVKVRLIVRYFMDVRDAPRPLGWIADGWLGAVFLSLSIQSWLPPIFA